MGGHPDDSKRRCTPSPEQASCSRTVGNDRGPHPDPVTRPRPRLYRLAEPELQGPSPHELPLQQIESSRRSPGVQYFRCSGIPSSHRRGIRYPQDSPIPRRTCRPLASPVLTCLIPRGSFLLEKHNPYEEVPPMIPTSPLHWAMPLASTSAPLAALYRIALPLDFRDSWRDFSLLRPTRDGCKSKASSSAAPGCRLAPLPGGGTDPGQPSGEGAENSGPRA